MKARSLLPLIAFAVVASAETLSIGECYRLARENYPMIRQFDLIKEAEGYDIRNAASGYLPQFSLTANAAYLSDVPEVMGSSLVSQTQHRVQIGVHQVVWDGGEISAQKRTSAARARMELAENEAILYELNDRVNRLFFGILLQDESLRQNRTYQKDIGEAIASVKAMIRNGTAGEYDLNLLQVELLKAQQREAELRSARGAYAKMLGFLVNRPLDAQTGLEMPPSLQSLGGEIRRPELECYAAQLALLEEKKGAVEAGIAPKLSLFGYGGYGKSSFASLRDERFYGVGGIALSWPLGNFYTQENEKRRLSAEQKRVRAQEEAFVFDTRLRLLREDGELAKLSTLLQKDEEIVNLRANIRAIAFARLKNGTITTTDYIRELNAKEIAEQTRLLHALEKLAREYDYKYLINS